MRKLMLHAYCSLTAAIVFTAAFVATLILRPPYWIAYAPIIFALAFSAVLHYTPARKKFKSAQLIVENPIICIQLAVMEGQTELAREESEKFNKNYNICVSTFGILLNDIIVEWGDGGDKKLKTVEIGHDYISIDCGTKTHSQNVRLLYARPSRDELAGIIKKFQDETGVVPIIAG